MQYSEQNLIWIDLESDLEGALWGITFGRADRAF